MAMQLNANELLNKIQEIGKEHYYVAAATIGALMIPYFAYKRHVCFRWFLESHLIGLHQKSQSSASTRSSRSRISIGFEDILLRC
jgi:hypothetical protein